MEYDREAAIVYAHRWAYARNPAFYNFDELGGDCTNFVSQCLYAGGAVMNFTPDVGWFYISPSRRSAAWSGANYLHDFLIRNNDVGPYGEERDVYNAIPGDVVFFNFNGERLSHSGLVVSNINGDVRIATHTNDSFSRPIYTYDYLDIRLVRILGINP